MKTDIPAYNTYYVLTRDYSSEAMARNETLFTVANGTLGLRGDFEEGEGTKHKGTYINGFYDTEPIMYGESAYGYAENHQTILNLPDAKKIELKINGYPFSIQKGKIDDFFMILDFKTGIMSRNLIWSAPDGTKIELSTKRLVPFSHKASAAIEYSIRCLSGTAEIEIESYLDTTAHNISSKEDPRVGSKFSSTPLCIQTLDASAVDGLCFTGKTRNSGLSLAGSVFHNLEMRSSNEECKKVFDSKIQYKVEDSKSSLHCKLLLKTEDEFILHKYFSYDYGNGDSSTLLKKSKETTLSLQTVGFQSLCEKQKEYLESFWKIAAISIEGDEKNERALHFNLFHLLQSTGKDGKTSIAAKGLTAEGYEGHYFWDTEAYVCPVFTYLKPDIAGKLLEYRYSILPKAEKRAKTMSLSGALFPWRTINGEETSAYYPAGTAQYHINADIMYALDKFLTATLGAIDEESLKKSVFYFPHAVEIAIETARMWMSLGQRVPSKENKFCINEVTGPDEYTACVNNNAFTNLMARENLRNTVKIVEIYFQYQDIFKNIPLQSALPQIDEVQSWKNAAEDMYIPYDTETGIYPQDDSFMDKADWDFEGTPKDKYPLLLHYHPLVIYRHRVLKQPDLVLAQFMLSSEFTRAEKIRNFNFYEPYTTGDSSLSHCIQSIMACEIGDVEKAEKYFDKTVRIDIDDIQGNTGDGIHTASMAGSWMSVVYGFAGFRDHGGVFRFNPNLLPRWKSLQFSMKLSNCILDIFIKPESVTYTLREGEELKFYHRNIPVLLSRKDVSKEFSLVPTLQAVLFDLDGVLTDTAELHYNAWKRISDEYDLDFNSTINEKLRGVSRSASFDIILEHNKVHWPKEEKTSAISKKNAYYVELLETLSEKNVLPGILPLFKELSCRNIKIVLASTSRNASVVCKKIGLMDYFDAIVNPHDVAVMKPAPDIYLKAAEMVDTWYSDCIGIEDAQAGVDALRTAGMPSLGIGKHLKGATYTIDDTSLLSWELLEKVFHTK